MSSDALVLANDLLRDTHGKTAHALVRGPSRYTVRGVIDASCAGCDAGEVLDGVARDIPVFESVPAALAALPERPAFCVVGVATAGGVLPPPLKQDLLRAAEAGMTLVNGLHKKLAEDSEIAQAATRGGAEILDLRNPRLPEELAFWTGEILRLSTPIVAVLGTDCALGKRTTGLLVRAAARRRGIAAEMIYTGQTGWLQGLDHGFMFDATPNDFVGGELERAILECARETKPDVILLEGQAALRNPSGPCGSEFIISGCARWVVLQHAPGRRHYIDVDHLRRPIPPVAEEIELIRMLGAEVVAIGMHEDGLEASEVEEHRGRLAEQVPVPVVLPLRGGDEEIVDLLIERTGVTPTS
jgi:uncharacterized NAD-dependent epimerase/dehydratase family protein